MNICNIIIKLYQPKSCKRQWKCSRTQESWSIFITPIPLFSTMLLKLCTLFRKRLNMYLIKCIIIFPFSIALQHKPDLILSSFCLHFSLRLGATHSDQFLLLSSPTYFLVFHLFSCCPPLNHMSYLLKFLNSYKC